MNHKDVCNRIIQSGICFNKFKYGPVAGSIEQAEQIIPENMKAVDRRIRKKIFGVSVSGCFFEGPGNALDFIF